MRDIATSDTPDQSQDTTATRFIALSGDLRDSRVLRAFHGRCEQLVQPGRRRVGCDLDRVDHADTRLVASLVAALRRARSAGVTFQLRVSPHVRKWIALCRLERLLRPDSSDNSRDTSETTLR